MSKTDAKAKAIAKIFETRDVSKEEQHNMVLSLIPVLKASGAGNEAKAKAEAYINELAERKANMTTTQEVKETTMETTIETVVEETTQTVETTPETIKAQKDKEFWAKIAARKMDGAVDTTIIKTAGVAGYTTGLAVGTADRVTKGKVTRMTSPLANYLKFKVEIATKSFKNNYEAGKAKAAVQTSLNLKTDKKK